ncbi:MAG: alpha/beta hydrolase [Pseudomonadales bacterium]
MTARSPALFCLTIIAVVYACHSVADIRLGVDWNGDGLIQTTAHERIPRDAPTVEQPFPFWINHDQDDVETGGESWPIARADGETGIKDSTRDLEDFTRLQVEIDDLATYPEDALLELAWQNGSGATLNLFRATDPDCSRNYLLNADAAAAELADSARAATGHVAGQSFRIRLSRLGAADLDGGGYCFLFDVASAGTDALVARILVGGDPVAVSPPLPMDLRHVKTFYQRTTMSWPEEVRPPWEYTTEPPPVPDLAWRYDAQGYDFRPGWFETDDVVVWIYGWLRSGEGLYEMATTQAGETVFKRLWHRGFRGRLIFFHWPTVKPAYAFGLLESEYRAYKSAPALIDFVSTIPPDKRLHLTAHSLGCVLLTEALKQGLQAEDALLQVGAIPAGAYDTRPVLTLPDMTEVVTPELPEDGGYLGYVEQTRTPAYSMYNFADVTFFGWNIAQKQMKPTSKRGGYRYAWDSKAPPEERARLYYRTGLFSSDYRVVTDHHEIMAFIAKSKTHALGAETRVKGQIRRVFDLARSPFEFHTGHVVGWTRNAYQTTEFYNLLLDIWNIRYVSQLL